MNLSPEFILGAGSVLSVILVALYKAAKIINRDTDTRVGEVEKDARNQATIITYLQKTIIEVQNKNSDLLAGQILILENERKREKELTDTRTDNLKFQMQVGEATRLKDVALANEKTALELVEKQNKIITEANDTIASLQTKIHALQIELSTTNGKLEGALAIAGVLKILPMEITGHESTSE